MSSRQTTRRSGGLVGYDDRFTRDRSRVRFSAGVLFDIFSFALLRWCNPYGKTISIILGLM